jgi:alpha-galactosidase/6-phospho-beta-glucosidase family protein
MAPRITIIGGGSYQWTPKLLVDLVNTPSLHDAEIVLEDINPEPIPCMVELAHHIASVRGVGMTARGTTDQHEALDGAEYVVVVISTGGFESMNLDVSIPERPPVLAEFLKRVSASQELAVEAAVAGDRDEVFEAMLVDPLAGRIDYDRLQQMTDEMLDATKRWLPQFA